MPCSTDTNMLLGLCLLGALVLATHGCSPQGTDILDSPLEQRANHFDHMLLGKVLGTMPDPRFDYGAGSDAYTAIFKVYCTYKGGHLPAMVNITEVGIIPGHCHATELQPGREYIVMVMKTADYVLKILHQEQSSKSVLSSMTRACGLTRIYPTAPADDPEGRCLEPAPPGECVTQDHNDNSEPRSPDNRLPSDENYEYENEVSEKPEKNDATEKNDESAYYVYDSWDKEKNEVSSSEKPQKNAVVSMESSASAFPYSVYLIFCLSLGLYLLTYLS